MRRNSTKSMLKRSGEKFIDFIEWYNARFEIFLWILVSLLLPYICWEIFTFLTI